MNGAQGRGGGRIDNTPMIDNGADVALRNFNLKLDKGPVALTSQRIVAIAAINLNDFGARSIIRRGKRQLAISVTTFSHGDETKPL